MPELRRGVKWLLFLSSYAPLFIILIINHWSIRATIPDTTIPVLRNLSGVNFPILSVVWLLLAVVSCFALLSVLNIRKSKGGRDFKTVDEYRSRDELITTYILVYIFPFVVLDYTSLANWVAFAVFFFVIGVIQVRSNQLYVNPILALLDYRIYEIDTGDEVLTLVIKGDLEEPVESVKTVELSNGVHMVV